MCLIVAVLFGLYLLFNKVARSGADAGEEESAMLLNKIVEKLSKYTADIRVVTHPLKPLN